MAEEEGFEPPIPFRVRQFSRLEPSTTRPLFRYLMINQGPHRSQAAGLVDPGVCPPPIIVSLIGGRFGMDESASRRKVVSFVLGSVALVLLCVYAALNAFRLQFLNPATVGEIVIFVGLSILVFVVFVAVLVLLVRNVLKLYADQRSRVLGTRLRTRMLWGAVLVSFIPIAFMYLFSYDLMNRAVERWFSQNPNEMREDSNRLSLELAQYTSANARA